MLQDIRLGISLLETATQLTADPTKLQAYNKILEMPGVDSALFLLYKASETYPHPKALLQSVFILGYYVCESLSHVDSMWENGPDNEPVPGGGV